jgi:hypothetical protein
MRLRKYDVFAYNGAKGHLRPGYVGHAYVVDNSANTMVYQTVGS